MERHHQHDSTPVGDQMSIGTPANVLFNSILSDSSLVYKTNLSNISIALLSLQLDSSTSSPLQLRAQITDQQSPTSSQLRLRAHSPQADNHQNRRLTLEPAQGHTLGMAASSSSAVPINPAEESRVPLPLDEVISQDRAQCPPTEASRRAKIHYLTDHFNINDTHAYRILQISPLHEMEDARVLLKNMNKLRVFDVWEYCSAPEDKPSETFNNTLLANLISKQEDCKKLRALISYLQPATCRTLTLFLLKMIAFSATTCQYLPTEGNVSVNNVMRALSQYPKSSWLTSLMQPQNGSRINLVAGWNIASSVFTANLEDLVKHLNGSRTRTRKVTLAHLNEQLQHWCHAVFSETVCYLCARISDEFNGANFVTGNIASLERYYQIFCRRSCGAALQDDSPLINRPRLTREIQQVRNGHPTMAEIHYCPATLRPSVDLFLSRRAVTWNADSIMIRSRIMDIARADDSDVETTHSGGRPGPSTASREFNPAIPVVQSWYPRSGILPSTSASAVQEEAYSYYDELMKRTYPEPEWLARSYFTPYRYYNAQQGYHDYAAEHHDEDFDNDDADSDDEYNYFEYHERAHRTDFNALNQGQLLENYYAELCEWIVDTDAVNRHGHIFSTRDNPNAAWVRWFMISGPGRDLVRNVTCVRNLDDFRDHFLAYSKLSLRANIISAMERLPQIRELKTEPQRFRRLATRVDETPFDSITVEAVTQSPKLSHVLTTSNNCEFCNDVINRIQGITLCVTFVRRPSTARAHQDSRFMFALIRSTEIRGRNETGAGGAGEGNVFLDTISLKFCFSRLVLRANNLNIERGDTIFFMPITSIASDMRAYRALHELVRITEFFRGLLFGPAPLPIDYSAENTTFAVSN